MIDDLRRLRKSTVAAFADALRPLLDQQPSEASIRDALHFSLSLLPDVTSQGWYMPPPFGMITAIGEPPDFSRLDQPSFRFPGAWPSDSIHYSDESVLYIYGARVHTTTGLISDSACTLYRGSDPSVRAHLRNVYELTLQVANSVELGMRLCDVYELAVNSSESQGLSNLVYSVTDAASTNIGHTIPWSNEAITDDEVAVLRDDAWEPTARLVNGKRVFVSAVEQFEITEPLAFSIEPRLRAEELPMANFHVVVAFENGQREIISEYAPLFELFGMDGFD